MRLSLVTPLTLKFQAVALIGFGVLLFARFPPDGSHRLDEEAEGSHLLDEEAEGRHRLDVETEARHQLDEEAEASHRLDEEDVSIPAS